MYEYDLHNVHVHCISPKRPVFTFNNWNTHIHVLLNSHMCAALYGGTSITYIYIHIYIYVQCKCVNIRSPSEWQDITYGIIW